MFTFVSADFCKHSTATIQKHSTHAEGSYEIYNLITYSINKDKKGALPDMHFLILGSDMSCVNFDFFRSRCHGSSFSQTPFLMLSALKPGLITLYFYQCKAYNEVSLSLSF